MEPDPELVLYRHDIPDDVLDDSVPDVYVEHGYLQAHIFLRFGDVEIPIFRDGAGSCFYSTDVTYGDDDDETILGEQFARGWLVDLDVQRELSRPERVFINKLNTELQKDDPPLEALCVHEWALRQLNDD